MLQIPTSLKSAPEALNSPGFRGTFLQQLGGGHPNRRLGVRNPLSPARRCSLYRGISRCVRTADISDGRRGERKPHVDQCQSGHRGSGSSIWDFARRCDDHGLKHAYGLRLGGAHRLASCAIGPVDRRRNILVQRHIPPIPFIGEKRLAWAWKRNY